MVSEELLDNIEEIIKKYKGVVKRFAKNLSDVEDITQELRIKLFLECKKRYLKKEYKKYNLSDFRKLNKEQRRILFEFGEIHNKTMGYKSHHTYFYRIFRNFTINFYEDNKVKEFSDLISGNGYQPMQYKAPQHIKKELEKVLELDVNYKHFLNPKFVNLILKRGQEIKEVQVAYLCWFLNEIVLYPDTDIIDLLGISERTYYYYKSYITEIITEILVEKFGKEYLEEIKGKRNRTLLISYIRGVSNVC